MFILKILQGHIFPQNVPKNAYSDPDKYKLLNFHRPIFIIAFLLSILSCQICFFLSTIKSRYRYVGTKINMIHTSG